MCNPIINIRFNFIFMILYSIFPYIIFSFFRMLFLYFPGCIFQQCMWVYNITNNIFFYQSLSERSYIKTTGEIYQKCTYNNHLSVAVMEVYGNVKSLESLRLPSFQLFIHPSDFSFFCGVPSKSDSNNSWLNKKPQSSTQGQSPRLRSRQ